MRRRLTHSALVAVFLAGMATQRGLGQQAPLQGGVQIDNVPVVTDVFAAGCSISVPYEATGDCSKLKDYVDAGGNDPSCKQLWEQKIAIDEEMAALSSRERENTNRSLSVLSGELTKQLTALEQQIEQKCRTPPPSPYPLLQRVRPRTPRDGQVPPSPPPPPPTPPPPPPTPDYFGATTGGMPPPAVTSCVGAARAQLGRDLDRCTPRGPISVADYQACAKPAFDRFNAAMGQCPAWVPPPPPKDTSAPQPTPDYVHDYTAPGASPPLRYQVGFNQSVSKCLANQVTIQNAAAAIWSAAFVQARVVLGVSALPGFIDAVVHPPGFSTSPDPYVRGKDEGARVCTWLLQLAAPINRRVSAGPLIRNGKVSVSPGFNFAKTMETLPDWARNVNPTGCNTNCGLATENGVRVLFGQPLEAAGKTAGWTDPQMEAAIGGKFGATPMTAPDMLQMLEGLPEGTVSIVSGENPTYQGTGVPPPGPITDWNMIPGHFFAAVKFNGLRLPDFQAGGREQGALPDNWIYRVMVVGNPLSK